jgi:hypothetical protein
MPKCAFAALLGGLIGWYMSPAFAGAEVPSMDEMWAIIQEQQAEIERLKARVEDAEAKVEAAGDMIEAVQEREEPAGAEGWWQRTQLGGYGELHYNGGDKDEIDFHRLILFADHDFSDDLRFQSEIEFEHAVIGEGKKGEVEIEQAYLEQDLGEHHRAKGGIILVPVGIINETHEPPTFFGVERPTVEKNIIPTTWREGGVAVSGELGAGFSYDLAVHSGLAVPTTGSSAYKIRNGRTSVSEAAATDPALTGRIRWTGYPGVEVGVSAQYQDDITQNALGLGTTATLIEAHTDLRLGGWGLRALYARWDLDEGPAFTGAGAFGRDVQYGWYVEPSYRFDIGFGQLGVFARYSEWDNEAGSSTDSTFGQFDLGLNYWPHPNVVVKIDGEFQSFPDGRGKKDNRLNVGLGYQF